MRKKSKILIVDDDTSFVEQASKTLKEENFTVHCVTDAEKAMGKFSQCNYDLVIADIILPGTDGIKLLEKIKMQSSSTDVIFCTNYEGVETAVKALKAGAYDYITKPMDPDSLRFSVLRCFDQRKIYAENTELKKIVELIETCKNISTTFDINNLAKFALEILLKETGASTAFFLLHNKNNGSNLESLTTKGIKDESKTRNLLELFNRMTKKWKRNSEILFKLTNDDLKMVKSSYKAFSDGIVIKIQVQSEVKAFIVLLNGAKNGEFTEEHIKNADFIIRETTLAFTNLDQYLSAKELAYIDDLSGLYNSRYLFLILDREIKRAKRFKTTLLLLFIDLDQFKQINDKHGHLVGGQVLKEVSQVILKCVREIDTVVRYGGDEYIVVLSETSLQAGRIVADRIRSSLEQHIFLKKDKLNIQLTACIGMASYPKHASTRKELIHFADMAMYMGKETTKNAVYIAAERLQ